MSHRTPGPGGSWARPASAPRPTTLDHYRAAVGERADALAAGEDERVVGLDAYMAILEKQLEGERMPTAHDTTKTLREGLAAVRAQSVDIALKLADGEISEGQASAQRDRLRRDARALDAAAQAQFAEAANEADAEARAKRAEWLATADPMTKYAADYPRLIASPADPASLAEQAAWMLDNGQPERASFLASVAADKGGRVDPLLLSRIDNALDASDPLRKAARTTEDELAVAHSAFTVARLSSLADAGFGINAEGDIGEGAPSQVAAASVHSKMAAYQAAQAAGVPYSAPVGDGTND